MILLLLACSPATPISAFRATDHGLYARAGGDRPGFVVGLHDAAPRVTDPVRVRLIGWSGGVATPTPAVPVLDQGAATAAVRHHDGLLERWDVRETGWEQRFVVEDPPADQLVVHLAFDGAARSHVHADGRSATFVTEAGTTWRYEGLRAWDADGTELDARMEAAGATLSLVVDTREAEGQVTVDPLLSSPDTLTTLVDFGSTVAGAGDVDGDGYDDLIGGADDYDALFLYYGSADGIEAEPSLTLVGVSGSSFGSVADGGGDLDGDGYDDVVVGAPQADGGVGAVYVFFGGEAGLSETADLVITGAGTMFGGDLAIVGDTNGDGYDDIAAGPYAGGTARFETFLGSATGPSTTAATAFTTAARGGYGQSLSHAGDVNADGYADVVYGLPLADGTNGEVRVYLGGASGLQSGSVRLRYTGSACSYTPSLGWDVDAAGDVNGDGYDDVIAASPAQWPCSMAANVYYGTATGVASTGFWSVEGGYAVTGGLNLDGDGYADVATLLDGYALQTWQGSATGLATTPTDTLPAGTSYVTELELANLGDVNGDGCSDLGSVDGTSTMTQAILVYYGECAGAVVDNDGDGWTTDWDCDDSDAAVLPWHCGAADQLVVDGVTTTVSGDVSYSAIWVVNGGVLTVASYNGSATSGWMHLQAEVVYVDASATIRADAAGYRGGGVGAAGEGAGGGAGSTSYAAGGGYGGAGGDATASCSAVVAAGGASYGSDTVLGLGSGGGGGATGSGLFASGARGGGGIAITAGLARIEGLISANGATPTRSRGTPTGGAGAGGGVVITADEVSCTGTIRANGGTVSGSGPVRSGSGAGGRVHVAAGSADLSACLVQVTGGTHRCTNGAGDNGSSSTSSL